MRMDASAPATSSNGTECFCHLIDSPYGRMITAGEDISNLTTLCRRVVRYHYGLTDEQIEQLGTILASVRGENRRRIQHGHREHRHLHREVFERSAYEPPIERKTWEKFEVIFTPAIDDLDAAPDS